MKIGIIYQATNTLNGKAYIGQTVRTLEERKHDHKSHAFAGSDFHFHKALRKYGFDAFHWEILIAIADKPEEYLIRHLNYWEKRFIYALDTYNTGYNSTLGGDVPFLGKKHTECSKLKMSVAKKGNKHSTETKLKISTAHMGKKRKPFSAEHKRKISIASKNAWARIREFRNAT